MQEDADEMELAETNKICVVQNLYKAMLKCVDDHDHLLSIVLKNDGEIDMEGMMNPTSQAFDNEKGSPIKAKGINL